MFRTSPYPRPFCGCLHRFKLDILSISDATIISYPQKWSILNRFSKTEKRLKITKLMSCMNFRITIQPWLKVLDNQQTRELRKIRNEVFCYYLYCRSSIVKKCFKCEYRHSEEIWTKYLIKRKSKTLHKIGSSAVTNIPWTLEHGVFALVTHPSMTAPNRASLCWADETRCSPCGIMTLWWIIFFFSQRNKEEEKNYMSPVIIKLEK